MVPGSTLMYRSNFWSDTFRPRAFSRRPSEAAVMPLPSDETTPPVTNTYLACLLTDAHLSESDRVPELGHTRRPGRRRAVAVFCADQPLHIRHRRVTRAWLRAPGP